MDGYNIKIHFNAYVNTFFLCIAEQSEGAITNTMLHGLDLLSFAPYAFLVRPMDGSMHTAVK